MKSIDYVIEKFPFEIHTFRWVLHFTAGTVTRDNPTTTP
jgi:hypothetical protein